jgi:hypothetical protein
MRPVPGLLPGGMVAVGFYMVRVYKFLQKTGGQRAISRKARGREQGRRG